MNGPPNDAAGFLLMLEADPGRELDPAPLPPRVTIGDAIDHRRLSELHFCRRCGHRATAALVAEMKRAVPPSRWWLDLCAECFRWLTTGLEDLAALGVDIDGSPLPS